MSFRTTEDYLRSQGELGLCSRCKLNLRPADGTICSKCHAEVMRWVFHDREDTIREMRDAQKGG